MIDNWVAEFSKTDESDVLDNFTLDEQAQIWGLMRIAWDTAVIRAAAAPPSGQPATTADPVEALIARITDCLAKGGLFNMEVMEAGKVRDLLIDCRRQLESALRASRTAGGGVTFSEMANPQDLSLSEQCCGSCGIAFFFMEAKDGDCSTQEVTFCPGCGRPRAALAASRQQPVERQGEK